jgi:uracil phosphoribosyltransferase
MRIIYTRHRIGCTSELIFISFQMSSVVNDPIETNSTEDIEDETYPENVHIMKTNNQLRELHTLLRDRTTCRSDFKFYADRLIRLTVEAALDQLPYVPYEVITPTSHRFDGLRHEKGTLCVSLMRSGEAMEKGIRECCR